MIKINGLDNYFGGKGAAGTYQQIINCIRPHDILIIPFLGNCAVTRYIRRSNTTIGIDADPRIIKLWEKEKFDWIKLYCGCGIKALEGFLISVAQDNRCSIYCDPPYLIESRKSKKNVYEYEMSYEDHERLLKAIKQFNCDVLISTYPNDLYANELKDWYCISFQSATRQGMATELLYMNYKPDGTLHDYSFLGKNFRERERIKKKVNRWAKNLNRLNAFERNAILNAITATASRSGHIDARSDKIPQH